MEPRDISLRELLAIMLISLSLSTGGLILHIRSLCRIAPDRRSCLPHPAFGWADALAYALIGVGLAAILVAVILAVRDARRSRSRSQ